MAEPATGSLAASAALATSAGGMALLSTLNSIPVGEYIPGTVFAVIGAVAWQFISAQVARETAAKNGVPMEKRPTIDVVTLGYSLFGAPLASGAVIALVHLFGGTANLLSLPGFLLAGAAGPTLVTRIVSMFIALIPNKTGGTP